MSAHGTRVLRVGHDSRSSGMYFVNARRERTNAHSYTERYTHTVCPSGYGVALYVAVAAAAATNTAVAVVVVVNVCRRVGRLGGCCCWLAVWLVVHACVVVCVRAAVGRFIAAHTALCVRLLCCSLGFACVYHSSRYQYGCRRELRAQQHTHARMNTHTNTQHPHIHIHTVVVVVVLQMYTASTDMHDTNIPDAANGVV